MGEEKLHLPKLASDGSNWITYRDRIQWSFKMRGLGSHLISNSILDEDLEEGDIGGFTPAQRWERGEISASSLLDATIPDDVFRSIKDAESVNEVWENLKALFEGKSRTILVDLGRKLQTTHCGEDDDVRAHFSKLANLRDKLAALGRSVGDDEYVAVLIGSLPPCYNSPIDALTSSCDVNNKDITPSAVIRSATREYEKCILHKENKSQEEAFSAEAKKKAKNKDIECYNCKKKGHIKAECWAKGSDKEGQGPKRSKDRSADDKNKSKSDGKDKNKRKGKDTANAAQADSSSDESWALNVVVRDPSLEEERCLEGSGLSLSASTTDPISEAEIYDSGASRHMSPFRHRFSNLRSIPPRPITAANNRKFYATAIGSYKINVPNGHTTTPITLKDTLYTPDIGLTVISVSKIADAGYKVLFEGRTCKIKDTQGEIVGRIPKSSNGLYRVDRPITMAAAAQEQIDLITAHRRLGHVSADAIRELVRSQAVTGLQLIDPNAQIDCDSCEFAKSTCKIIQKKTEAPHAQAFGDEIHSDLWGPAPISSLGGRKFYVTFTDDHTRFTRLMLLKSKDEMLEVYKSFAVWAQTQHGVRLRSDRRGEYMGKAFTKFLKSQGTERRLTTHDTPQHNRVVESLNRRLVEHIHAILYRADLP